jgi:hypothetical protein
LWGLAAARCSNPKCRVECIEEGTDVSRVVTFGKIAHIVGHSDNGPRGDSTYPAELRDKYENLILLCGNHHDVVDGQDSTFTVEELRRWKVDHERWVRTSLAQEMPSVGFAELEIIAKGIFSSPAQAVVDLRLTPPAEKMKRNGIGRENHWLITMGLGKAREVEAFVSHLALIDDLFPERLKAGFLDEYKKQYNQNIEGDELFAVMHDFASGHSNNFKRRAAGLAVLVYLFEKCEVFEP